MASTLRSPNPESQSPGVVTVNNSLVLIRQSNNYYYHSWSGQDEQPTSHKIYAVILGFMSIFLSLLQLKNGGGGVGVSPYRTHPVIMGFSNACLLMGCLAYLLKNVYLPGSSLPRAYGQALERATLLLESLSLASLVPLLLPSSWTPYCYVAYVLLSVGVGALMCSKLLKCKLGTSSENETARGNLLLSGASSVDQEADLPV